MSIKQLLRDTRNILIYIRFLIPSLMLVKNEIFMQDVHRWKMVYKMNYSDWKSIAQLLWLYKEFRNVVYYRLRRDHIIRSTIFKLFYPLLSTLYITTPDIGGGLFIHHGFSTVISAKSIGKNCWINQQVTIGWTNKPNPPVIGDDVTITCGAKVLGDIHVGNKSIIGANAVVVHDVPNNVVVGGIPAKVIKQNI